MNRPAEEIQPERMHSSTSSSSAFPTTGSLTSIKSAFQSRARASHIHQSVTKSLHSAHGIQALVITPSRLLAVIVIVPGQFFEQFSRLREAAVYLSAFEVRKFTFEDWP